MAVKKKTKFIEDLRLKFRVGIDDAKSEVETDYYESEACEQGVPVLCWSDKDKKAYLLLPSNIDVDLLKEMANAIGAVVYRGTWKEKNVDDALKIIFFKTIGAGAQGVAVIIQDPVSLEVPDIYSHKDDMELIVRVDIGHFSPIECKYWKDPGKDVSDA